MNGSKIRIKVIIFLAVMFLFISDVSAEPFRIQRVGVLGTEIDGSKLEGKNLFEVIEKLAAEYRIRIGFEDRLNSVAELTAKPVDGGLPVGKFRGDLRSFLDFLSTFEPRFSWELKDGVIDFFPTDQRDLPLQAILDTRIGKFSVRSIRGVMGAGDAICKTTEVRLQLRTRNLTPIHFYSNDELEHDTLRSRPIELENVTVRDILNTMTAQYQATLWTAATWGPNNEYLTITLQ